MPPTWTIAYRNPRANRFLRADDLAVTWAQAREAAALFGEAHPDLQVWYTTTVEHERGEAERIAAGTLSARYADDHGNIMVDSGRRVRVLEGGHYGLAVPDAAEARARYEAGAH